MMERPNSNNFIKEELSWGEETHTYVDAIEFEIKALKEQLEEYESLLAPVKPEDRKDFIIKAVMGVVLTTEEAQQLQKEREEETISLERAKKYARHQHFLGTQQKDLIEFEDWKYNPKPKR